MKTALTIGIIWAGACFVVLWLNYRFHRHYTISDDQGFSPELHVEMESRERAADSVH